MTDDLQALERLMVIEDQPAWALRICALAATDASAERLFVDVEWFGQR